MEILLFLFFLLVFIGMLVGGYVIRSVKKMQKAARQAAERREQQFRDEVGRQRQQYSQRQQTATSRPSEEPAAGSARTAGSAQDDTRRQDMATGETVIDFYREERESRKIFSDDDGEYTDFVEVKE